MSQVLYLHLNIDFCVLSPSFSPVPVAISCCVPWNKMGILSGTVRKLFPTASEAPSCMRRDARQWTDVESIHVQSLPQNRPTKNDIYWENYLPEPAAPEPDLGRVRALCIAHHEWQSRWNFDEVDNGLSSFLAVLTMWTHVLYKLPRITIEIDVAITHPFRFHTSAREPAGCRANLL